MMLLECWAPFSGLGTTASMDRWHGLHGLSAVAMTMANEITAVEPIPAPDMQRPARPISLPHWAEVRLGTLKTAEQPDRSGRYRTVPVLPVALMLTLNIEPPLNNMWQL